MEQIFLTPPKELTSITSQVLNTDATPLGELSVEPIGHSVGQATAGICRVAGRATTAVGEQPWSVVVKVLGTPAIAITGLDADALREVEVYRSGIFAELCGGIRAAHCYAIHERGALQLVWLEDLSQAQQPPWPTEQYLATANHLGQFNAYWPETDLPQWEWLNHASFRDFFKGEPFKGALERLSEPQRYPLIAQVMPSEIVAETLTFWHESERLFEKVATAPSGICHLDCHSRNLFPIRDSSGHSYTVAIDWAQVGIGAYGVDIGHLLADQIKRMNLSPEALNEFADTAFGAYINGLMTTGWSGNSDQVELVFLTRLGCEALRNMTIAILSLENEKIRHQTEQIRKGASKAESDQITSQKVATQRIAAQRIFLYFKDKAFQL